MLKKTHHQEKKSCQKVDFFLSKRQILHFYDLIFKSKSGHAKSMNIDLKLNILSSLSPKHHKTVRKGINLQIWRKRTTLMFM